MSKILNTSWPLLLAAAATGLLLAPVPVSIRYTAGLILCLFLPGWVWSFPLFRPVARLLLSPGLSIALTILASMVAVYLPGALTRSQLLLLLNLLIITGWGTARFSATHFPSPAVASSDNKSRLVIPGLLLLLVLTLALLLRLPRLGYAEFHEDEAEALMLGVRLLQGEDYALFLHRKGPAQMLLPVTLWLLTGQITETLARLPFALSSLFSVAAIFAIGRHWFNREAAIAAALLWAINGYAVAFGRMVQYQALIFFMGPLAIYLLWLAIHKSRPVLQVVAAVLLAASLLAHFDALLLLPAAAYLLWVGYRTMVQTHNRSLANLYTGSAILLFTLLLAIFYVPFVLDPEFQNTTAYLTGSRVKPGLLYNNLPLLRRFDQDYSSHFYLPLLLAGIFFFLFMNRRPAPPPPSQNSLLSRLAHNPLITGGLFLLLVTTAWLPAMWQVAAVNLAVIPWLALGGVIFFRMKQTANRAALLLFGAPAVGYLFLVEDPRTHLYVLYPGAVIIAGAGWAVLKQWTGAPRRIAATALLTASLLVGAAVVFYLGLIFLQTESAFIRLRAGWEDSIGEFIFDDLPKPRAYFGYPKREGWKAIGALRAEGNFSGDFRSVNEDFIVPIWYNYGEPRSCYDTPAHFFIRLTDLESPPGQTAYPTSGYVTRETETRLEISSRPGLEPAQVELFAVEAFIDLFDPLATPEQFTRQSIPAQPLRTEFGATIEFVGFDQSTATLTAGETLYLNLYWRALTTLPENYRAFVHLTDGINLWAQQDDFPACRLPTNVWRTGQRSIGQFRLQIAPDTPPGSYPLIIGLYQSDTLERLRITGGNAGQVGDDFLWLGDIEVIPQ
jgi:hypothetical protein